MQESDKLKNYKDKRNFSKTPEPQNSYRKSSRKPIFVIQQHAASHMHFDFRLEMEGVLASWAVPRGPSTDPRHRRLAVRTEDHPLDYADFEGRIPPGEYGAGTVIVWDTGHYESISSKQGKEIALDEALNGGHAKIRLFGKKLKGGYALIHTRMRGDDRNWLLVKENDEYADPDRNPVSEEPQSVLSGRTVKEMGRE
jgi:DNA ligase D-like protein (predicted 3'-phosphoesterase)